MEPLAHPANASGQPQTLTNHTEGVAEGAANRAAKFGASGAGRLAGLCHDIGKAAQVWQDYMLSGTEGQSPGHSGAGALLTFPALLPVSMAIAGHHGGLPSRAELKVRIAELKLNPAASEAIAWAKATYPELATLSPEVIPAHFREALGDADGATRVEFFTRMLFSALVDADWLDTERHENQAKAANREGKAPGFAELWAALNAKVDSFPRDGLVNQIRRRIWEACVAAGVREQGVYRLTVPTGGGKTLSAMGFALRHVLQHDLDRVIVAVPYTSIIEQNAEEYRSIFGEYAVLEHHSNLAFPEDFTYWSPAQRWARLATENWDAAIIVTTTVQLFESMFSNRPSKCRKLHNLARSVIILDEVQNLPTELLETTLDGLRELVAHYGVTVLLCSATQPALNQSPYVKGFPKVEEIAPDPPALFAALKRVRYDLSAIRTPWTWSEVAAEMRKYPQVLTVVNTRQNSQALFAALDDPDAFHLSRDMAQAHRQAVLQEIKERLKHGLPCRVVATTLIQAGVNLDFPVVMRAMGPLDGIVQAAGRCNRDGKLNERGELGLVIVFTPAEEEHLPPGIIKRGTEITRMLLSRPGVDLDNPALHQTYFTLLYANSNLDLYGIQRLRRALDFPAVAEKYRLIADDQVPVVVPYVAADGSEPWRALLEEAQKAEPENARRIARQLQRYSVDLHRRKFDAFRAAGLIAEVTPGLYRWLGPYDSKVGLKAETTGEKL